MFDKHKILEFLHKIETGEVILMPRIEPQEVLAGTVKYDADNGWAIAVFNDANAWDYIEWLRTNDGEFIEYDVISIIPELEEYVPSDDIAWCRYGIPGYMKRRCKRCGSDAGGMKPPFICNSCKNR